MTERWSPDLEFAALMRSIDKDVRPAKWRLYWWLRRAVIYVFPPVLAVILVVVGVSGEHRREFTTQFDGCQSAVATGKDTIEQARVDVARRGRVAAGWPYPGLPAAFESIQTKCFDQKYLSALQHDRAQFDTVRAGALDAWRYATGFFSPAVGQAGPTGEDQLIEALVAFLDSTLLPDLRGIKASPTAWNTLKGFVGLGN